MTSYLWNRLPPEQHQPLIEAHANLSVHDAFRILNRYRVAPGILTTCCGVDEAWAEIKKAITNEWIK